LPIVVIFAASASIFYNNFCTLNDPGRILAKRVIIGVLWLFSQLALAADAVPSGTAMVTAK
jgi:hypothetical protein